jgi:DNA-binding NtrC family response regulator
MPSLEKHVMVVDDDPDIIIIMKQMLKNKGYQVHGFTEPLKALEHAQDCRDCGVMVTDLRMPQMNGFKLVRKMADSRPDMKVVLMTAYEITRQEWQLTIASTKVDQFLTKPFKASHLIEAIEKCAPLVTQS